MRHHVLYVAAYFIRQAMLCCNIWELVKKSMILLRIMRVNLKHSPLEGRVDVKASPFGCL